MDETNYSSQSECRDDDIVIGFLKKVVCETWGLDKTAKAIGLSLAGAGIIFVSCVFIIPNKEKENVL